MLFGSGCVLFVSSCRTYFQTGFGPDNAFSCTPLAWLMGARNDQMGAPGGGKCSATAFPVAHSNCLIQASDNKKERALEHRARGGRG
jgi:hypothetical protein